MKYRVVADVIRRMERNTERFNSPSKGPDRPGGFQEFEAPIFHKKANEGGKVVSPTHHSYKGLYQL